MSIEIIKGKERLVAQLHGHVKLTPDNLEDLPGEIEGFLAAVGLETGQKIDFNYMWADKERRAKEVLDAAGIEHGPTPPPDELDELSETWFAWEILTRIRNVRAARQSIENAISEAQANPKKVGKVLADVLTHNDYATREASMLGYRLMQLEANNHPLPKRGWNDREQRRQNGRKAASFRRRPAWREEAHRMNASLVESSEMGARMRAGRIARSLGLRPRTVLDEIASPKRRARYSKLYR